MAKELIVPEDNILNTADLYGVRVFGGKDGSKKIGKVRTCVFHPRAKQCVGLIVRRPDVALMFHRKDLFVAFDGYEIEDGRIYVIDESGNTDKAACKRLGINWDECVLWAGMPILSTTGESLGSVGSVSFDAATGKVVSVRASQGSTANTLLGTRDIPAKMIKGFKRGIGEALAYNGVEDSDPDDETMYGAILVDKDALGIAVDGGVAEKAGRATAVAADKAQSAIETAKPVVKKATKATGEAVNKGAFVTGRQIGRATGMFSAFKEEYDKARHDD